MAIQRYWLAKKDPTNWRETPKLQECTKQEYVEATGVAVDRDGNVAVGAFTSGKLNGLVTDHRPPADYLATSITTDGTKPPADTPEWQLKMMV
jgi:hypothetical protein